VVPLAGLLIGTLIADYLFKNQFYVIIGAVLGLLIGFLWVKGHLIGRNKSGVAFSKKYQAVILRLADDETGLDKS
jgi:sigma-E factor negative regulatory protein RseC